jgi:hypothetical protein
MLIEDSPDAAVRALADWSDYWIASREAPAVAAGVTS